MMSAVVVPTGVLDPQGLLSHFGSAAFIAVLAILIFECGVIFGAVMPGDSLLFVTGMLIQSGFIAVPLWVAIPAMVLAAFAGNVIGYWTGAKIGPALFRRPDSRLFKQEYVERTHQFFERYGVRAIVLARFVPIVRAVITSVAGIARMDYRVFLTFSAVGAAAWVTFMTLAGVVLGHVEYIRTHIDVVTLAIVALSAMPIGLELIRARKSSS
jgi:membrane-associated protein